MPDESYRFIDNLKADDKVLYAKWGLHVEHFRYLAQTLGKQDAVAQNLQVRYLPEVLQEVPPRKGVLLNRSQMNLSSQSANLVDPKVARTKRLWNAKPQWQICQWPLNVSLEDPKAVRIRVRSNVKLFWLKPYFLSEAQAVRKDQKNKKTLELENAEPKTKSILVSIRRRIKNE